MEYEVLRSLVLEWLKNNIDYPAISFKIVTDSVIAIIIQKNLYQLNQNFLDNLLTNDDLFKEDRGKIREILWEFIIQGILVPGLNEGNPNLPYISLTDWGRMTVNEERIMPHDPDGYLRKVKDDIPNIDPLIELYLTESLQAYLKGLMFSSAVMLGVASESAFNLLHETITNSIVSDSIKHKEFVNLQNSYQTKRKYDAVKLEIMKHKNKYPREISEILESHLDGVFNIIRITRNDAGHPSGKKIERSLVYVNLQLFVHYLKTVSLLIDWYKNHTI